MFGLMLETESRLNQTEDKSSNLLGTPDSGVEADAGGHDKVAAEADRVHSCILRLFRNAY